MAATGFYEDLSQHTEERQSSDASFGVVFTVFFAGVAFWPLWRDRPVRWWALTLSVVFLVITLIRPSLLHYLNQWWGRLALLLAKVVNPLVLSILFFLVFTPVAALMRLLKKDPLLLRFDREASSYWRERQPPGPPPDSMPNEF